ncbi:MAG: OFA family MFS transporter [Bacillota bacterium]|nr:OFA family MFS transporter [Bacillota bacterium]
MRGLNRGTVVTLAGLGINLVFGMLYVWGVISAALIDKLGWTATQTQIPFMLACASFAFIMGPGGRLQDKYGPRPMVMLSALVAGAGFALSGVLLTVWGVTVFFGLLVGIGMGVGYSAPTPAAVKWFGPEKRGLISGIVVSGVGLGPIYIAPLTAMLITRFGLASTFYILGATYFVFVFGLAQFISNPPTGFTPPSRGTFKRSVTAKQEYSLRDALKTPQYYILWLMFAFGTFAGLLIIGQLSKIGLEQAGITSPFVLVAIYSFFNFLGRIGWGIISDKLGRRSSLFLVFALQFLVYLAFPYFVTPLPLIFGMSVVGFTFGGMLTLFPAITGDFYGMKNFGLLYGVLITAWGFGGVIGPLVGGLVRDLSGTYILSYLVSAAVSLVGAVLTWFITEPKIPSESN